MDRSHGLNSTFQQLVEKKTLWHAKFSNWFLWLSLPDIKGKNWPDSNNSIWNTRSSSLVPRPVRAIRVTRGGLETSAIARGVLGELSRQAWQVTSHPKSPRTTGNEDDVQGFLEEAHLFAFHYENEDIKTSVYMYYILTQPSFKETWTKQKLLFTCSRLIMDQKRKRILCSRKKLVSLFVR